MTILEQLNISDKLDLKIENQRIIISPLTKEPRNCWSDAFTKMHDEQQDNLLISVWQFSRQALRADIAG